MPIIVAALPEIVIALAALLLVMAFYFLFRPILVGMSRHIPIIGGPLSAAIDTILTDSYQAAMMWSSAAVRGIEGFVLSPVYWFEHIVADFLDMLYGLGQAIYFVVIHTIPNAINAALGLVRSEIDNAIVYLESMFMAWIASVQAEIVGVEHALAADISSVEQFSVTLFNDAEHYTTEAITAETQLIGQVESALTTEIGQVYNAAISFTETAVTDLTSYIGQVETALSTEIAAGLTGIESWAGSEIQTLIGYIDAVQTQTIALTLGAVAVVEEDLGKLESECTDNLCSGLTDLANILNGLAGDLGLAALFALGAEFASDPVGTAHAVDDALTPIVAGASSAVRALIGI